MQTYISQLIADLEAAAANPPHKPWIEPPLQLENNPEIAELALVPFKPISEWTGIGSEMFPEVWQLDALQCTQVNEAIFKLLEALHLSIVDLPDAMPPEILYEVLTTNWDHPVQYLHESGMDVELCTFDPLTCPYGEYCDCNDGNDVDNFEEYNGFFDDNGNKINLMDIPIPDLCLGCSKYLCFDSFEDLLCDMNRYDQREDDNFNCGAFVPGNPVGNN